MRRLSMSPSSEERRRRRSPSSPDRRRRKRSRQKRRRYKSPNEMDEIIPIKQESDLKNHVQFQGLPRNLYERDEQDIKNFIKQTLSSQIGPVEHVSFKRQGHSRGRILLGFKYDIDAVSYIQGNAELRSPIQGIKLKPQVTEAFSLLMQKKFKMKPKGASYRSKRRSYSRTSSQQISSSKSRETPSAMKKEHHIPNNIKTQQTREIKLLVFGVPIVANEQKLINVISSQPGGPYHCLDPNWSTISQTNCEFFEFYINYEKGRQLLDRRKELEIEGRPLLLIRDSPRQARWPNLFDYQVVITFPKLISPFQVLKHLNNFHIVQILAFQKPQQQDGRYRSFHLTLNDQQEAYKLKRVGDLSIGIRVSEPREEVLVYRPRAPYTLPARTAIE